MSDRYQHGESRRYQVHEALGKGGFGTVYRADLLSSGGFAKSVAIKVLNADVEDAEGMVRRLRDEARVLGLLRHRAIVQVDDLVSLDGRWSIVMEYVEGLSLQEILDHGPLPPGVVLEIVEEVAGALHLAYTRPTAGGTALGLLHRDIKPSNIQITPAGEVKLLDFGVARADFGSREAKTRSVILGSLPFLAPERFDLEDTHAGDVYALGVTMAAALTGVVPERTSPIPRKHAEYVAQTLARVRERVDHPGLIELLEKVQAYWPEDRPTARDFEREARALHRDFTDVWLKEWAEDVLPPLVQGRPVVDDELSGSLLVDSEISGARSPDAVLTPEDIAPPLSTLPTPREGAPGPAITDSPSSRGPPGPVSPVATPPAHREAAAPPPLPLKSEVPPPLPAAAESPPPLPTPPQRPEPPAHGRPAPAERPPPAPRGRATEPQSTAARPPRRRRKVWRWVVAIVALLLVVAAAVVVTPVLMVGGGGALLVGMVWGDAMDELVVESFMDMDLRMVGVHGSPAQAHLNDLVRHAITDPMVMNIGFWELLWFEIEFDEAIADGFVTDAELRSLHQRYGRITSS